MNLAFAESRAWWLLCPYDVGELPPTVLQEARRNHPFVLEAGEHQASLKCRSLTDIAQPFDTPLPVAPVGAREIRFNSDALTGVRRFVEDQAGRAGLDELRSDDLVLAVNEIVTNSVRYAGGQGVLRMWETPDASISEVRDSGHIDGPMIGRLRPTPNQSGGFGVWIANQVCDLVRFGPSMKVPSSGYTCDAADSWSCGSPHDRVDEDLGFVESSWRTPLM